MRTWNCVHGYAALILAAALIMTACGDAESGPGGGGGGGGSALLTFGINRAEYIATSTQDFIFTVDGLNANPSSVKVGAADLTWTRSGNKITVTGGLSPTTLSTIDVIDANGKTGTLKGMFTYDPATPNKDTYTDLLTVINNALLALTTHPDYDTLEMGKIKTDVNTALNNTTIWNLPDDGIDTYFTVNNMSTYNQSWANGIDTAMGFILNNYSTVQSSSISDSLKADLKARLIRIYMNKTNPANDAAIQAKVEADIKTSDVDSLSMLPPAVLQVLQELERMG
jgi:hypothetical protein